MKHKKISRWPTREEREVFVKELAKIIRLVPEGTPPEESRDYLNEASHIMRLFTSLEDSPKAAMEKLKDLGDRGSRLFSKEEK